MPAVTWRRWVAVAVVGALVATGCTDDGGGDDAVPAPAASWTTGATGPAGTAGEPAEDLPVPVPELAWSSCGAGLECATLPVPLDWEDPTSPIIDLAVARRPATGDPDERIGVLALNPGGPGASGTSFVEATMALPGMRELNRRFDLVSWDPRGVGDSTPIVCDDEALADFRALDPEPDTADEQAALDDAARAYAEACLANSPEVLPLLGTDQTVEDLDLLRAALGEEQLSWLGFSYGTYLGQVYADAHPDRVRAMVLDGVVDPADGLEGLLAAQAVGLDELLATIFADCDADPGCPVDDAAAVWEDLTRQVETEPLPARGGDVGPAELAVAAVASSYDAALSRQLLVAMARAEDGDGTLLRSLAETYWGFGDYPAYVATLCADVAHAEGAADAQAFAERLAAEAPGSGAAVANEILPCAWFPMDGPAPAPIAAAGAPTILVIGNTGDVATPIENAERVAAALDDAVLVVHEGEGHTSFNDSACVQAIVIDYLVDLAVPEEGTVCPD